MAELRERIVAGASWNPGFGERPQPPRLSTLARFIRKTWPELRVTLEPWTVSTDQKISGSRLRRPGKGRKGKRLTVRDPQGGVPGLINSGLLLLRHDSGETYRHNGEVCAWIKKRLEEQSA